MHDLVDSHSHIDVAAFAGDRDAAIARAHAAGVRRQIVPAIAAAGWGPLRALCGARAGLHPAYGLHPMYIEEHRPDDLDALAEWASDEDCVAIGECGLDFHVEGLDARAQRHYFLGQLELARELGLPVIVHARKAVDEVIATLRRVGGLRGVVHSFSGSREQAEHLWRLDFMLGIGGPVTYERAQRLRGIVASMPLEFLLLETDSPDQPLATHRGERNEPAHLVDVLDCVARLRNVDADMIATATTRNAERLFGL
ncbi:MAG TPA: TatD family hydrolase [Dokdonella sp.]|uniref:TatD family hydrolase n=1 Tax=Dokdonella sp. TaxID=2291710 RepID=UPI0025C25F32|nr:TatD family hydrolase [Dokdonella sp.]MBX3692595.1 TatD family hydrolase [Dokdonella sp.]MCW5569031.1 TatD family hydrolase [Dokdonella sp.]HNR92804.1 TatD family hydrolase [Dokdonella sp.]